MAGRTRSRSPQRIRPRPPPIQVCVRDLNGNILLETEVYNFSSGDDLQREIQTATFIDERLQTIYFNGTQWKGTQTAQELGVHPNARAPLLLAHQGRPLAKGVPSLELRYCPLVAPLATTRRGATRGDRFQHARSAALHHIKGVALVALLKYPVASLIVPLLHCAADILELCSSQLGKEPHPAQSGEQRLPVQLVRVRHLQQQRRRERR